MKNLITSFNKLESLPSKIGINKDLYYCKYDDYKWYHRWNNKMWNYTERFIRKNIGKPYNDVFHEYLNKIKEKHIKNIPYENAHYVFNDYFDNNYVNKFYVDSEGLIQECPKYIKQRKSPIITSVWVIDPTAPYRLLRKLKNYIGNDIYNKGIQYGLTENEYLYCKEYLGFSYYPIFNKVSVRFNGWEDLNENEKKKFRKENKDRQNKISRELKRVKELELENLLHIIVKDRIEKEKQENIITRDRLGFDENSFKLWKNGQ